jgi:hypothetical protein
MNLRYQQYRLYGHGRLVSFSFAYPRLSFGIGMLLASVPGFMSGWIAYGVFHG